MRYTTLILVLFTTYAIDAQVSIGGTPFSFSSQFQVLFPQASEIMELPADKQVLTKPYDWNKSFTVPIQTSFDLKNSGRWLDLPNGDRLWQLTIKVPSAHGLVLMYDKFHLPHGSKFFVYDADKKQVLGAYTHQNSTKSNRFLTGIIKDQIATIEYYEPKAVKGEGHFRLFRVDALKKNLNEGATGIGFGTSASCHTNINCQEGTAWQDVKRGICRVMMVATEGIFWCTGNLLNNTNADGVPYLLSGHHCIEGITPQFDLWRFDFNYEGTSCINPIENPSYQSLLGCELRSKWEDTDLLLVALSANIPQNYNAYYLGWDVRNRVPEQSTLIHHPFADIKKITLEQGTAQVFNAEIPWLKRDNRSIYKTPIAHHFRVTYNQGGTFQGGSSGAGMFDEHKRLVGQLHGGIIDTLCRVSTAYFGRLHKSWEGGGTPDTRLKDWLDPMQTGILVLDGVENPAPLKKYTIKGTITTTKDEAISDVELMLNGELVANTDILGQFFIENLDANTNYEVKPSFNQNPSNGLSVLDLIQINNHILNKEPFESVNQLIAADSNNSKSLSLIDLIKIQRVMLNIETNFENNTSWRFIRQNSRLTSVEDFNYEFEETFEVSNLSSNSTTNFTAIKIGDVNSSAKVKQE